MEGLPPLGGAALGLVGAVGFLSSSPSSRAQAPPPSECSSLVSLQGLIFRDHTTSLPPAPWAASQGFTDRPLCPSASRPAMCHHHHTLAPLRLLPQPKALWSPPCCSNTSADPSDHELQQSGRAVLGHTSQLSQDLAIELTALLSSSGCSPHQAPISPWRGAHLHPRW